VNENQRPSGHAVVWIAALLVIAAGVVVLVTGALPRARGVTETGPIARPCGALLVVFGLLVAAYARWLRGPSRE